jgi:hypothetical protein
LRVQLHGKLCGGGGTEGLQALKQRLTDYVRWGKCSDFADFDSFGLYDRKRARWLIPRAEVPLTLASKSQLDLVETLLADLAERGIRALGYGRALGGQPRDGGQRVRHPR